MSQKYILALDQGTTSSRAILFNAAGRCVAAAQQEFAQIYPKPGWVEHDPMAILGTQTAVAEEAMARLGIGPESVAALGITNQRETTVVWERATGRPVHNAIVWQCRRTAGICDELKARGLEEYVRENTGLVLDAYFSGTKLKWILDQVPGARQRAADGELLFGTVDTWLIWNLTGGKVHCTDYSNASRTLLFNIKELAWDRTLLDALGIPAAMLPEVRPSSGLFGETAAGPLGGIPIAGDAGDQQAALFGQACFSPGMAKNTYGTGCFLLMNTGARRVRSDRPADHPGLGGGGQGGVALEGSVFVAGAAVQWLRDELELIDNAAQSENLAAACRIPAASISCPPSWAWGPRTGTCTPAAPWSASPAAPAGTTWSGRPWKPSPTRPGTS